MYVWDEDLYDYVEMDQAGMGAGSTYAAIAVPNTIDEEKTNTNTKPGSPVSQPFRKKRKTKR